MCCACAMKFWLEELEVTRSNNMPHPQVLGNIISPRPLALALIISSGSWKNMKKAVYSACIVSSEQDQRSSVVSPVHMCHLQWSSFILSYWSWTMHHLATLVFLITLNCVMSQRQVILSWTTNSIQQYTYRYCYYMLLDVVCSLKIVMRYTYYCY